MMVNAKCGIHSDSDSSKANGRPAGWRESKLVQQFSVAGRRCYCRAPSTTPSSGRGATTASRWPPALPLAGLATLGSLQGLAARGASAGWRVGELEAFGLNLQRSFGPLKVEVEVEVEAQRARLQRDD